MGIREYAAWTGTVLLGGLAVFQLLLALGLPLGKAAWGGKHRILPSGLRLGSLAAVGILAAAAWVLLARAGLASPGSEVLVVRIAVWVLAVYFGLNVGMNLVSKSPMERAIMTPVSALLVVCYVTVLFS